MTVNYVLQNSTNSLIGKSADCFSSEEDFFEITFSGKINDLQTCVRLQTLQRRLMMKKESSHFFPNTPISSQALNRHYLVC